MGNEILIHLNKKQKNPKMGAIHQHIVKKLLEILKEKCNCKNKIMI